MQRYQLKLSTQRGAAIIVALFIMSLVAAASVAMMMRTHIAIRRTELLLNADQANQYANGSVAWAIDTLNSNWLQHKPKQPVDRTPIESPTANQDGFSIKSTILDMQGYFNINNLASADYQDNFVHLLQLVDPTLEQAAANDIVLAIKDWISPVIKNSGNDNYYTGLTPPYRAPHQTMSSVSELRLIKGMTSTLFQQLLPYITALPEITAVNINNAAAPVLMSLSPTLTTASAAEILQSRRQTLFADIPQFLAFAVVKNNPIPASKITTTSRYFLLKTYVTAGRQHIMLNTLLLRTADDKKSTVIVLWQTKGTL